MMELTDAYDVARSIANCIDPPVIRSIFSELNERFPYLTFEYSEDMKVNVTDRSKGIPIVIKDLDDNPV